MTWNNLNHDRINQLIRDAVCCDAAYMAAVGADADYHEGDTEEEIAGRLVATLNLVDGECANCGEDL